MGQLTSTQHAIPYNFFLWLLISPRRWNGYGAARPSTGSCCDVLVRSRMIPDGFRSARNTHLKIITASGHDRREARLILPGQTARFKLGQIPVIGQLPILWKQLRHWHFQVELSTNATAMNMAARRDNFNDTDTCRTNCLRVYTVTLPCHSDCRYILYRCIVQLIQVFHLSYP